MFASVGRVLPAVILCADVLCASSFVSSDKGSFALNEGIDQGVRQEWVEAVLTQRIRQITTRYDDTLKDWIWLGRSISKDAERRPDAKTADFTSVGKELVRRLLLDLLPTKGDEEGSAAFSEIDVEEALRCIRLDYGSAKIRTEERL